MQPTTGGRMSYFEGGGGWCGTDDRIPGRGAVSKAIFQDIGHVIVPTVDVGVPLSSNL